MNVNLNLSNLIVYQIMLFLRGLKKKIRTKNLNRIVLAHLNINSVRNKFDIPPVDTRRRFNLYKMSIRRQRRRIDIL